MLNRTFDPNVSCINFISLFTGNYGVSLLLPRVEIWRGYLRHTIQGLSEVLLG